MSDKRTLSLTQSLVLGHRERPLLMQLALAAGASSQAALKERAAIGNDFWAKPEGRQVVASMEKVVEGLRRYQLHPYQRRPLTRSIVWSEGESRILWYAAKLTTKKNKPRGAIVLIPSMINGAEIMDILPNRLSLVRWLSGQGFDVFLFEWGQLRDDSELATLDDAIAGRLRRAMLWLREETQSLDQKLFALGYCMGGLFLAGVNILEPDAVDASVFVATPWDFHAGRKGCFAEALAGWAPEGLARVAHLDYMPAEWLQMIFAGVDPSLMARKFSAFAEMDMNSAESELFVAVEDWVNGGCDLPSGVMQQTVRDWYLDNKTAKNKWKLGGVVINPKKINIPSLVIVPARDKIVSPASASDLAYKIPDAYILEPDCGHISMMVGSRARQEVWKPLKDWLIERT